MKTEPIFLKKSNTTIQFVEIGADCYLLIENHNRCHVCGETEPIRVIKQEPLNLDLLRMGV